jgi:hypothetical protein
MQQIKYFLAQSKKKLKSIGYLNPSQFNVDLGIKNCSIVCIWHAKQSLGIVISRGTTTWWQNPSKLQSNQIFGINKCEP